MPFDQIDRDGPQGPLPDILVLAAQEIFYRREVFEIGLWFEDAVSELQALLRISKGTVGAAFDDISPSARAHYDGKMIVMGIPTNLYDDFAAHPYGKQPDPIINLEPASHEPVLRKDFHRPYTFPTVTQLLIEEKRNFLVSLLSVDRSSLFGHQIFEIDHAEMPTVPDKLYLREVGGPSNG